MEGYSSEMKYTLRISGVQPDNTKILSIYYEGIMIFNESSSATDWGFSPDEDRFVMHGTSSGFHWCTLVDLKPSSVGEPPVKYQLISSSNSYEPAIRFSPNGKYILYATISYQDKLLLNIFDSKTGASVYNVSGVDLVGFASGKSVAGWGFSPDAKNATFVHAYQTDIDRYTFAVVNLTKTPAEDVVRVSNNLLGTEYWRFSPCGDKFARIFNGDTGLEGLLYSTNSKDVFSSFSPGDYENLFSAEDGHYIKYHNGLISPISEDITGDICDDKTKPVWGPGTMIDTGKVEGVRLGLHWDGATDENGVSAYRIYIDGKLYKEIENVKNYVVTGLKPDSSYLFTIKAGDETGNWSDSGPSEEFSTFPDQEPTWSYPSDPKLDWENKTETKIHLLWNRANDDFGIEYYRILVNGDEAGRVGKDTLNYHVNNLIAATVDTFQIEAVDAALHKVTGSQLIVTMWPSIPPYWGSSVLTNSDVTETSMTIHWPEAGDNFKEITGYQINMNGDSLTTKNQNYKSYELKNLEEGAVYSFDIIAIDESNNKSIPPLEGDFSTLHLYIVDTLVTRPGNQKDPDIDGNLVVWWDDRNGNGEIYSYDLQTDLLKRVTDESHEQFGPAVSGGRIVWTDTRNGNWDIYMFDPELGEVPVCTAPGSQDLPAIDGDIIVWRDGRNGDFDIYMYDIKENKESPVCTRVSAQNWPDVSGNYVVYADNRNGNWDIYMYSILDKKETSVCTNSADQTYPVISKEKNLGLTVIFMDERDGKNIYISLPQYNGWEGREDIVQLDDYPPSDQIMPHMADKQLVFQDLLGGIGTAWNIYAYQFFNDVVGDKKQISVDPISASNQTHPRTSKGNIVWQYEKDGNSDIYIWKRPPGSDLQLSVTEVTDPVKVGDTLKYIVKVKNNGPNNNFLIQTKCTLPLMAVFKRVVKDAGEVKVEGKNITWDIARLDFEAEATMEIYLITYEPAILEFTAETDGLDFDQDQMNNSVKITTKAKFVMMSPLDIGAPFAMTVEDNGRVHLACLEDTTLIYATKTRNTGWVYKSLGLVMYFSNGAMVMTPDKMIHIIYSDFNPDWNPVSRLTHGILTPEGNWSSRIIAVSLKGFHSLSLDADSEGELYLSYLEAEHMAQSGHLMILKTVDGEWQAPVLVSEDAYDHSDIYIDSENNTHISFYNFGQDYGIVYQKWNGNQPALLEQIESEWQGGQMEGMINSVITDNLNLPHISYVGSIDNNNMENLKHAWKKDGVWNSEKVDDGTFQSRGNQVAADQTGTIYFGYGNLLTDQLRFSTNVAGPWIRQIIEEGISPWDLDMAMDQDGYGHLAVMGVGYALIPPLVYFEVDPKILDFGAVETDSVKTLVLKLNNPSAREFTIDSVLINDPRFTFSKTSFSLGRYANDSVKVTFTQTESSAVNSYLKIWYNGVSGLLMDIPVKVRAWQAELTAEPSEVDFGAVPLSGTGNMTVILKNTGSADLNISNITVNEFMPGFPINANFYLNGHNCTILAPGQTCEVQLSFQPAKIGPQYSYLTVYCNDPKSVPYGIKINLNGKTPAAQIYPAKSSIDFGYVPTGQVLTDSLILVNTGDATLNITGVTITGADADQFSIIESCTTIAPDDSCKLRIRFSPSKQGDFLVTLSIISNSQYSGSLNIQVSGTSYLRELTLSTKLINFGNVHVGEQSSYQLKLQNTGSTDLTIGNILPIAGSNQLEFKHNFDYDICHLLAPGSTCTDTVWFVPLFEGAKMGTLIIPSDDSDEPEQTVVLSGQAGTIVPLKLNISADPEIGKEPLGVQFRSLITGGQPPYTFNWDFDDLKSSSEQSPLHVFTGFGVFDVVLIVTDLTGNSVTETIKIAVAGDNVPAVIANAEPVSGEIPLIVRFHAECVGGNLPITFLWDFGDGNTSVLQNPSNSYSAPGTFNAKITVTDADGDTGKDSVQITVIWNNSLAGQLWDETGTDQISKSQTVLYPQVNINDTTMLVINGSNSYHFQGLPDATYTVQAIPDTVAYTGVLPTYYGDKIALFEASWVQASGHVTGKDIKLINKPPIGTGTGTISGDMVSGSGKGLTITEKSYDIKGNPVPGTYVFLKNSGDGKLKAFDITSTDGSFSFKGLDNGSYYFVTDYQGKPMDAANTPLVISDSRKEIEILATVGTDKITVKDLATGIDDAVFKGLQVYPVPAASHIMVEIPEVLFKGNSVRMRILDLSGKYIFINKKYDLSGNPVTLDIDLLKDGMYLLEVSDNEKSYKLKIIKM